MRRFRTGILTIPQTIPSNLFRVEDKLSVTCLDLNLNQTIRKIMICDIIKVSDDPETTGPFVNNVVLNQEVRAVWFLNSATEINRN